MEILVGGFMGKMMNPMMKGKMAKMINHEWKNSNTLLRWVTHIQEK